MRALCTVRGPLGAGAAAGSGAAPGAPGRGGGALGAGARLLALRAPGLAQPLHFVVEAKSRVRELREFAHKHFGLHGTTEADLFGLALLTSDGEYMFIDADSKLSKYAPKSWRSSHTHGLDGNGRPLLELHLAVQFYVERAESVVRAEPARRLYYLQLRANASARGLPAPPATDSDPERQRAFIRRASRSPQRLDSHRYAMKSSKTDPDPGAATLSVTPRGVNVGDDVGLTSAFAWSDIAKLSFDRKKFEIRTARDRVTLYSPSEDKAKYLFALCRDTHQFSMRLAAEVSEFLREPGEEDRGRDEQRVSLVSSGSSNTTSGVVSDRVHSEDELEIMIDSPPALSTESLALAHLLDREESDHRQQEASPQCSSSCSTVVAGCSHTQHNSQSERDPDYGPFTMTASSETSGIYTMGGSESTAADTVSRASLYLAPCASIAASASSTYDAPSSTYEAPSELATDCVDGDEPFRPGSAASFHGDGSDPTDNRRALLSASELSDLIVGRGAYPTRRSVSDTLDSVSDYVRLPPPREGESYVRGHEDTAPDDTDDFFERPPTPPARVSSELLTKPPPPYEFNHTTISTNNSEIRSPPPYPDRRLEPPNREEVAARLVTSKPMITILKAEAGEVSSSITKTFAGPVSAQPERLVAMLKPPPPPPRRARLPPPPPPPPPPHLKQFHQQLCSDVDYVVYPLQDPRISQRNYLESKLLGSSGLHYRSTPFLSSAFLSDSCSQLTPAPRPGRRPLALPRCGSEDLLTEAAPLRRSRPPPPPPPPPPPLRHLPKKECAIDIKTLREKSKNLDLPLISALCNDRSLLKQTKAFGPGDSDTTRKTKSAQNKRILVRNPNDKLPEIPGGTHTPRAMSNTYVSHPGASASKLPPRT